MASSCCHALEPHPTSGPGSREGLEAACAAAVMAACTPTAAAACFEDVAGQPPCSTLRGGLSNDVGGTCEFQSK